jgi:hypothetical protein
LPESFPTCFSSSHLQHAATTVSGSFLRYTRTLEY